MHFSSSLIREKKRETPFLVIAVFLRGICQEGGRDLYVYAHAYAYAMYMLLREMRVLFWSWLLCVAE